MYALIRNLAAGSLLSIIASLSFAAPYTMRLSHQYPPQHQVAKALDQFAQDVRAASAGRVDVQLFGAEQLFKATQNHAAVAKGDIEAAVILSISWGATIPEMAVTSIPFMLSRAQQLQRFPQSSAAQYLNTKLKSKGVVNIGWLLDDNWAIFTSAKKPLIQPADFRGIKIRGQSKLTDEGLIAMGASPSSMPGSEVYQALLAGVIDAGYTGVAAAYSRRYYEAQKFGTVAPITTVYANLVVNPRWWSSLPEDIRKSIETAARTAEVRLLPKNDQISPALISELREKGMQITVLDPAQQKALSDVMQPAVVKAFKASASDGEKIIELINQL